MRPTIIIVIVIVLVFAILGFFYVPMISVTQLDNGVKIENVGRVDCLVSITSPQGVYDLKIHAGGNYTITNIPQPIEVSVISKCP